MKNLIKLLGSLSFAIVLLAALVAILTASTLMESAYGTPVAQRIFYQAGWFDAFLSLVAVNILCSALSRWPYKLHHTGFLITHVGILLLLTGSLLSRLAGVEGQMALREGEKNDAMLKQSYQLAVREPEKKVHLRDLDSFSTKSKTILPLDHPARRLIIEKVEDSVVFTPQIRPGNASSAKNHAIRFTLHSQMASLNETFWLVENSPETSFSSHLSVGLAELELKEGKPVSSKEPGGAPVIPQLRFTKKNNKAAPTIALNAGPAKNIPLKEIGLTVSGLTYFPDARVDEKNELINTSDTPRNPAVRFTLDDGKGHREQRILFRLFPDFEAIHGKKNDSFADLKIELIAPESELAPSANKPGLVFYFAEDGWTYEARSKKGTLIGLVGVGTKQPTGWMDFSFQVEEIMDNAVVEKIMTKTGSSKKGDAAMLVSLAENGQSSDSRWVSPGEPATFETPEGPVAVALGAKSVNLPFRLKLLEFRKKDYPGTRNAASYESDAVLEDPADGITLQKTIWMNHPLDYKGYRIFQSSYIQDPKTGNTSIFTIAKNPGIVFIYSGAIIIFIGIICVFYVKPFSYLNARSSHSHGKK